MQERSVLKMWQGESHLDCMTAIAEFGIETFEKPILSATRRRAPVVLEQSEESAKHVWPFFIGKGFACRAVLSLRSKMTSAFLQ